MRKTESPLKSSPLRNPGQSLDEKLQDLIFSRCYFWLIQSLALISVVTIEWMKWFMDIPHKPITYTLISFPIVVYFLYRFFVLRSRIQNLKQGRDGEKVVGQYLESFRASGGKVFHDIVGSDFNVDHVLICYHGVFAIETKTYSKPAIGSAKIIARNDELVVDGWSNKEVFVQARAGARWIANILSDSTGKKLSVHPVILLPGWYVDSSASNNGLWVLNPKALPAYVSNQPKVFTDKEVNFLSYSLSRYIRSQ